MNVEIAQELLRLDVCRIAALVERDDLAIIVERESLLELEQSQVYALRADVCLQRHLPQRRGEFEMPKLGFEIGYSLLTGLRLPDLAQQLTVFRFQARGLQFGVRVGVKMEFPIALDVRAPDCFLDLVETIDDVINCHFFTS